LTDIEMIIRPYLPEDENAVILLWQECGLLRSWNDPKADIQRKLKVNPELFLVGLINGKVAATVMGGYEGHRGWVNYLAVDPRFRRQGIGRQMMEAVEARLQGLNCPKINLQVRESNKEVITFYRRLGYAVDAVISLGKRLK